jgi:hypothetical protein
MSTDPNHIRMINDARCDCGDPCILNSDLDEAEARIEKLEVALKRIRDSEFPQSGSATDRMDAVRAIAREALE